MCLQEPVEMVPNTRDPVDDLHQLCVACSTADLCLDQLPPQVTTQKAFHRLRVVGTQHPPDYKTYIRTQTSCTECFPQIHLEDLYLYPADTLERMMSTLHYLKLW